ncbi:hypothetical protein A2U01_0061083, partial [Trifolium medium]|nr:hypothetical protein [Trifolium medium]
PPDLQDSHHHHQIFNSDHHQICLLVSPPSPALQIDLETSTLKSTCNRPHRHQRRRLCCKSITPPFLYVIQQDLKVERASERRRPERNSRRRKTVVGEKQSSEKDGGRRVREIELQR